MTIAAALSASIRSHAERHGIALVPFVTAGWPKKQAWGSMLQEIGRHAGAIEVGIPFSDPMADGVTIQRSSREALEQGVTPRWALEELGRVRKRVEVPLVLMSYLNPLLALGGDLPSLCRDAGIEAVIIPDLPYEECGPWRATLAERQVGLVQMVTPMTPSERLSRLARETDGFLYAVSRTGVTGKSGGEHTDPSVYLKRCREAAQVPVCAGFGIRTRADVERLVGVCDGAIVGSALVDAIARGDDAAAFLRGLRE